MVIATSAVTTILRVPFLSATMKFALICVRGSGS